MARETDILVRIGLRDENSSAVLKDLQSRIIRFVGAVTASIAAIRAITFPIAQAAEFERALKDVQKTTGFTDRDIGILSGSLLDLSRQLGISAIELTNIAAIAGQLGLGQEGRDAVVAFTEAVAEASVALGDTVEATAEYTAQLSSIFKIPIEDVKRITGVLNEVSNASVATASQLADITKRIGDTAGLTFTQTTALAGYVRELGVPVEQAGTGIVNSFINLQTKTSQVLDLLGQDAETWAATLRRDPIEALKEVAAAIAGIEDAGEQADVTKSLFGSGRQFALAQKIISDAVNDFAKLDNLLEKSSAEFQVGTSATKEYTNIMEALLGQVNKLGSAFSSLVIEAGLGAIGPLVAATQTLIEALETEAAQDFARNAATALADLVTNLSDAVRALTQTETTFQEFIRYVEIAAKVIGGVFVAKVLIGLKNRLVTVAKNILELATAVGARLIPAFRLLISGNVSGFFAALTGTLRTTQTAAATMETQLLRLVAGIEASLVTLLGLFRQVVAQLDALIVKMGAAEILANRLATKNTAALGATTAVAAGTAAAGLSAASVAVSGVATATEKASGRVAKSVQKTTGLFGKISAAVLSTAALLRSTILPVLGKFVALLTGPFATAALIGWTAYQLFAEEIDTALGKAKNAILGFFGFQRDQQIESVETTKRLTAQQVKNINEAASEYEAAIARFQRNVPTRESTVGDLIDSQQIRGNIEESERALDAFVEKIRSVGGVVGKSNEAIAAQNQLLQQQELDLKGATSEVESLRIKQKALVDLIQKGTPTVLFGGDIFEATEELAKVDEQLARAESRQSTLNSALKATQSTIAEYGEILQDTSEAIANPAFLDNIQGFVDQSVLAYARARLAAREAAEELRLIQIELDKVEQQIKADLRSDSATVAALTQEQATLTADVALHTQELREHNKLQTELLDKVKGQGAAQEIYLQLQQLSTDALRDAVTFLNQADTSGLIQGGNAVAESFSRAEESIRALTQFNLLQRLEEDVKDAAAAVEFYADAAESMRENTLQEISAIEKAFLRFRNSLEFEQTDFEIDIKFETDLEDVEREFEEKEDLLKDKYKVILDTAIPSQRAYWAERERAELRSLENERKIAEAVKRKERIQFSVKAYVEDIRALYQDIDQAATVNDLSASKSALKERLGDLRGLVIEARQLETIDPFGKTAGAFSELELQQLVGQVRRATTTAQDKIREGNDRVAESTQRIKEDFTETAGQITAAYNQTKGVVDELRKIFPDIDKVIASIDNVKLPDALRRVNESLTNTISRLSNVSFTGISPEFDFSGLEQNFNRARGLLTQELGPEVAAQLQTALNEFYQQGIQATEVQPVLDTEYLTNQFETAAEGADLSVDIEEARIKELVDIPPVEVDATLNITDVKGNVTGNLNIQANARGGFIQGPGTATSDSILSWLSNGEYVMDAFTTRFFGSGFFKGLQELARSGRRPNLPGFAEGGAVGNVGSLVAAAGRETVDVNLNLGGSTYSLFGEREQVKGLVSALKRMDRGA